MSRPSALPCKLLVRAQLVSQLLLLFLNPLHFLEQAMQTSLATRDRVGRSARFYRRSCPHRARTIRKQCNVGFSFPKRCWNPSTRLGEDSFHPSSGRWCAGCQAYAHEFWRPGDVDFSGSTGSPVSVFLIRLEKGKWLPCRRHRHGNGRNCGGFFSRPYLSFFHPQKCSNQACGIVASTFSFLPVASAMSI
jgi:hypothetical protein